MKRIHRLLLVLAVTVVLLLAVAITANATEIKTGIGIVDASALRLREEPNTESDTLAMARRGDAVIIIKKVGDWYQVSYNLEIGYVHSDYIVVKEKENVKIGYASFDSCTNVRSGPSTSTSVIAQAPKGETCFIIGFNCQWFKVSYNGSIGYVRSDLVTMLEMPYSNYGSTGNTYKEPGSSSSSSGSTNSSSTASSTSSSAGDKLAAYAKKYLGYKYVYGGASPSTGFDCSGFVYYVAKQCGYTIGRTATAQLSYGKEVSRSNLMPGDIVLFERTYSSNSRITHSGIYIGNGQFIHAANSRSGVIISSLNDSFYSTRFVCGRRLG